MLYLLHPAAKVTPDVDALTHSAMLTEDRFIDELSFPPPVLGPRYREGSFKFETTAPMSKSDWTM